MSALEDAWQARRFAAAQPGVISLFDKEPYNLLPINWSVKRGQPGGRGVHEQTPSTS